MCAILPPSLREAPAEKHQGPGRDDKSQRSDKWGSKRKSPRGGITLPGNPAKSEISPPKRFQKHSAPLQATNRFAPSQDCSKVCRKLAHDRKEPPSMSYMTQRQLVTAMSMRGDEGNVTCQNYQLWRSERNSFLEGKRRGVLWRMWAKPGLGAEEEIVKPGA